MLLNFNTFQVTLYPLRLNFIIFMYFNSFLIHSVLFLTLSNLFLMFSLLSNSLSPNLYDLGPQSIHLFVVFCCLLRLSDFF